MSPPRPQILPFIPRRTPVSTLLAILLQALLPGAFAGDSIALSSSELDALLLGEEAGDWTDPIDSTAGVSSQIDTLSAESLAAEILADLELDPWQQEWTFRTGVGATDNALFTSSARQESFFSLVSVEYLGFRLPGSDGSEWFLYLLTENRHFLSVSELSDEYLVMAQAAYRRQASPLFHWEAGLASLYNDRVFGLSPLEDTVIASPVEVLQTTGTLQLETTFTTEWTLISRLDASHAHFRLSADDYDQLQPVLALRRDGQRNEFEAGLRGLQRHYADRPQQDQEGFALADSKLRWKSVEGYLSLRHDFDADRTRHWRGTLSGRLNRDNGPGYHDFHRLRFNHTLSLTSGPWEWTIGNSIQWSKYPKRLLPDKGRFDLWSGTAEVSLKRELGRRWTAELSFSYEETQSAERLDGYRTHQAMLSLWMRL